MTTEVKGRGRPPVMDLTEFTMLKQVYYEVTTRRGCLNKHWESQGFAAVKGLIDEGVKGLEYLADPVKATVNAGILCELGRFDLQTGRELALHICQEQLKNKRTVREWAHILKTARLSETVSDNSEVTK